MKSKKIIAAAATAALLFGGAYYYFRDDVSQILVQHRLEQVSPEPSALQETDSASSTHIEGTKEVSAEENETLGNTRGVADMLSHEAIQSLMDSAKDLHDSYPDTLGWLYIPDTVISYPVMQANDNDYYLSRAYDGSQLQAGSLFLDCRCESRFMNPINIVYGHNMKNGSMFAQVTNFKNDSYFESHKYGWLATPETVYRIDFFSCAVADWHDSLYEGDTPVAEWVPHIYDKSVVGREITYSDDDRFVSLSTCSYEFQNARTILTGKLVEMNGG